jgi:hypothetical protein
VSLFTDQSDNKISIVGVGQFRLTLAFNVVLKWFEKKDEATDDEGPELIEWAYTHFIDAPPELAYEDELEIVVAIVREHIAPEPEQDQDDTNDGEDDEPEPKYYDFNEDAPFIYASFLQDYGIDLVDQVGRLSWKRFSALLEGLRDDTKFKQVIAIRKMPIPDGKDPAELARVVELKDMYRLKCVENDTYGDDLLSKAFDKF